MKDNKKEKLIPELRFPEFEGEWRTQRLDQTVDNIGGTPLEKFVNQNAKYKFISIGNYSEDGRYIDTGSRIELNEKTKTKKLEKGNIVMVLNDKTSSGNILGSSILVDQDNTYIYNQRSERLIVKQDNPNFLWFLINSPKFRRLVYKISQGGTQIYVNYSMVKKIFLKLPSPPEQQKISSFLSLIDKKIELLKKKKELLELYKKGVMQKIFNREIRFKDKDGNDYPEWEEKRLGEIAKVNKGEQKNRSELREEFEYPVINGGQEPSGFIDTFNTPKNTITISEGGNSCGFVNFITKNFWSGGHCYTLEGLKKSINQYYLYSYLKYNEKKIMRLRVGSGLPNIQEGDIQKFKVVVPSLEEQLDIKKLLKAINKSIEFVNFNLENTKVFKKGLLQKMFI